MRRYMGFDIPEVHDINGSSRFKKENSPYIYCMGDPNPNPTKKIVCEIEDIEDMSETEANDFIFRSAVNIINEFNLKER